MCVFVWICVPIRHESDSPLHHSSGVSPLIILNGLGDHILHSWKRSCLRYIFIKLYLWLWLNLLLPDAIYIMLRWRTLCYIFALLRPFKNLTNVRELQGYFLENVAALSMHVDTTIGTKCCCFVNSMYSWMRSRMASDQVSGSDIQQVSVAQLVSALDC
jgi:hypothetical protein